MILQDTHIEALQKVNVQLSIVIPVYNQEKNVSIALDRIKRVVKSTGLSYEIIVVDDGSRDGTMNALRSEATHDSNLRIVSYSQNMGKGYAVKLGITSSHGDIVIFTDGDLDISPHMITEYIEQLQECDLVIASKRHPESRVNAPLSRRFLSKGFNLFVRILTGIKLKDTQSGLKAGNGKALSDIFRLMLVKRYAFDVELLALANLLNFQVKEMPIEINLDRSFKLKDIARMSVDLLAISYRLKIRKWYQKRIRP